MKQSLQLCIFLITIILITVMSVIGQGGPQELDGDVIQSHPISTQLDIPEKDHNIEALQLATQTIEGDSLKISVWDNLQMQIWKWQNGNWVNQIFGTNNKGFKLFFNENNMASYFYGNDPTLVSNTMPDNFTIETVVSRDNIELTQTVSYTNGNNYYTIRWDIWNRTGTEIDSLKFFAGEDTYFAGSDYGRGYWDNNNNMVYVKNTQGGETGIMGFYGAVSSPAIQYYEGYYSMVRTAVTTGILPNTVNPVDHDAAYALGWRYNYLAPNNVWTISARETFQNVAVDEEAPTVTVLQPNGGETLSVGSTMSVNWTASDNNAVTKIDVRLSTDGGNRYTIVNNDLTNTPPYTWTITEDYVSDNCKIKVIAYDAAFNFAEDESDAVFSIRENGVSETGSLSGHVTDATTGNGIGGATVTVAGISTTTDEFGNYTIENIPAGEVTANFSGTPRSGHAPLTVQFTDLSGAGYQPLTASAEGYFSYETSILLTSGEVTHFDISLSPTITEGELRLVINWGATPDDLDIHLKTPEIEGSLYEVWYNAKGNSGSPPYAVLDHDDTDSFGPETITIYRFFTGTYKCYVHNYSESPSITTSSAVVQVYGQVGLIETIYVPTTGEGLYWYVCDIDGATGTVSVKNTIQNDSPEGGSLRNLNLKKSQSFSVEKISTATSIVTWQWDFDNNGTIDATTQHPSHTYTTPGTYTVKLTVSDGTSSYSETKANYITVLPEEVPTKADFTVTFSSIDISAFPVVKSFVSIIDTLTNGPVQGLVTDYISVIENAVSVSPITVEEISSSSEAKADITFVFDVTGSMGEEIEGLKERSLRFADSLAAQGIDYRLGLVTYSDEVEEVHDFTGDANEFKAWIDGITVSGGGDEKENALEALARAAILSFRATTQKIIVLITDADYHEAGETGQGTTIYTTESMISMLNEKAIVTNVVGPNLSQFHQLADHTGGLHYDINGDFQTIIDNIGTMISSQYVISYTSRNPIADNTTRTVAITVEKDEKGGYGIGRYTIGTSRLVMSPANTIGIVNTTFTIDLNVESIVDLGLCHFFVTFDPTKIEAADPVKGDFLERGGASSIFVKEVDNATGNIEITATRTETTTGVSGSGIIGSIEFKVLTENCTSDISYSMVDLRKPNNDAIPVSNYGTHIEAASVSGLLGDFDNDLDIDTRDFALLSTYWKPINSTIGDIGPASGTPPVLTPIKDALVNFEDLFVFARMWNWYHDTHRSSGGELLSKPMANLEWQVSADNTDGKLIHINLWANDIEQLAMGHLTIQYNSDALTYQSAQAGELISEDETTVAFIADTNPKKGIIDIALARLPSHDGSAEVSGSGVLTMLEFSRSGNSNNPTVSLNTIDLRTANNVQIAVSGTLEQSFGSNPVPTSFSLEQNYPNPFNNSTQIIFQIPQALNVKIEIMNILGQQVKTLVNHRFDAGTHHISWDGKDDTGKEAMSGIYIMRMEAGTFRQTREMLYIK